MGELRPSGLHPAEENRAVPGINRGGHIAMFAPSQTGRLRRKARPSSSPFHRDNNKTGRPLPASPVSFKTIAADGDQGVCKMKYCCGAVGFTEMAPLL